mmetsp:Transcript_8060/g.16513  ORF Transcript_8060/g.16513 Transcript_8060/m.16513 type:complete len:219 (-) Transcript_8060:666-1322(-)
MPSLLPSSPRAEGEKEGPPPGRGWGTPSWSYSPTSTTRTCLGSELFTARTGRRMGLGLLRLSTCTRTSPTPSMPKSSSRGLSRAGVAGTAGALGLWGSSAAVTTVREGSRGRSRRDVSRRPWYTTRGSSTAEALVLMTRAVVYMSPVALARNWTVMGGVSAPGGTIVPEAKSCTSKFLSGTRAEYSTSGTLKLLTRVRVLVMGVKGGPAAAQVVLVLS